MPKILYLMLFTIVISCTFLFTCLDLGLYNEIKSINDIKQSAPQSTSYDTSYMKPVETATNISTGTTFTLPTPSANQIVGKIYDSSTNLGIDNCMIRVGTNSTYTDISGDFTLNNVNDGFINIVINKSCYMTRAYSFNKSGGIQLYKSLSKYPKPSQYETCIAQTTTTAISSSPETTNGYASLTVFIKNEFGGYYPDFIFGYGWSSFYISQTYNYTNPAGRVDFEISGGIYNFSACITSNNSFDGDLINVGYAMNIDIKANNYYYLDFNFINDISKYINLSGNIEGSLEINVLNVPVCAMIKSSTSSTNFNFRLYGHDKYPAYLKNSKDGNSSVYSYLETIDGPYNSDTSGINFTLPPELLNISIDTTSSVKTISWDPIPNASLYALIVYKHYKEPVNNSAIGVYELMHISPTNSVEIPTEAEFDPSGYYEIAIDTYIIESFEGFSQYLAKPFIVAGKYKRSFNGVANPFSAVNPSGKGIEKEVLNRKFDRVKEINKDQQKIIKLKPLNFVIN